MGMIDGGKTLPLRVSPVSSSRKVLALEFIRRYWRDHGASPSFREIAAAVGASPQHVGPIIRYWVEHGKLSHIPGQNRSIEPTEPLASHSTSEIVLELLRRGIIVNGFDLKAYQGVTELELVMRARLADTDHGSALGEYHVGGGEGPWNERLGGVGNATAGRPAAA